jgi:hypothetical protein
MNYPLSRVLPPDPSIHLPPHAAENTTLPVPAAPLPIPRNFLPPACVVNSARRYSEAAKMIFLALLALLYFLPTIVAASRGHDVAPILILNLFLGWTVLAWFAMLLWALLSLPPYYRHPYYYNHPYYRR